MGETVERVSVKDRVLLGLFVPMFGVYAGLSQKHKEWIRLSCWVLENQECALMEKEAALVRLAKLLFPDESKAR